jgi:hypothetical protein
MLRVSIVALPLMMADGGGLLMAGELMFLPGELLRRDGHGSLQSVGTMVSAAVHRNIQHPTHVCQPDVQ